MMNDSFQKRGDSSCNLPTGLPINVHKVLRSPTGSAERCDIDEKITFADQSDLPSQTPVQFYLILRALPDQDVHAEIRDLFATVPFCCNRCLETFTATIHVPLAEKQFYWNLPKDTAPEDRFEIDKKSFEIDISELLRQEILLHFPSIAVCSKSCKGLCQTCGKNLNRASCRCKKIQHDQKEYPFKNLKNIIDS